MITQLLRLSGGLAATLAMTLASATAAEQPATAAESSGGARPPPVTLAAYRAESAGQARNYDRTQDISPRQLVILLEVSERIAANLGQALATGELESARTWNDHVRPTLKNGSLGSATGVWQFLPGTFHSIVKKFGAQLLAASEADTATGREHLDLGEGPFTDAQVRDLIQETVAGKRGAEDEELQLLRHNFAVLAFAKHYLSIESGATTPEEDYLFHFLGAGQGRRVLALARGEARDTLCVKAVEPTTPPLDTMPGLATGEAPITTIAAIMKTEGAVQAVPTVAAAAVETRTVPAPPPVSAASLMVAARSRAAPAPGHTGVTPINPGTGAWDTRSPRGLPGTMTRTAVFEWGPDSIPRRPTRDEIIARMKAAPPLPDTSAVVGEPAIVFPVVPDAPPPVSSQWGLPANSPTVTGNLGMFYRDGKGQTQPYTWGGFMENLARRVRAKDQPALVRAKYGVGFALKGGDLPQWVFNPEQVSEPAEFRHENGRAVLVPEALVTGPLGREETRQYKQRLAGLVSQGEDKPLDTLPPEALSALYRLSMLPPKVREASSATTPQRQKALHNFRKKVGKDEPDNPAHFNLLMPAERIALEIYDQRLTRYAQLQTDQLASFRDALDLNRIRKMSARLQRSAAPHIAALQTALAAQGLLTQPTQKSVWRDKKRKKHVEYKPIPFAGKADKVTVTALNSFQWRNGLLRTQGILDTVTLKMLSLPPLGPELFLPLSGPQCDFAGWGETAPNCAVPSQKKLINIRDL